MDEELGRMKKGSKISGKPAINENNRKNSSFILHNSSLKLTPMLEQYLRIKEENPGALLFFRMGDFYELFFEDAEIAARELQIALTSRNPNAETQIPMAGVPHHAAEEYLRQLLDKGYKVAICEQVEDPKKAKRLVKRAVTRILTPGTVVEEANLTAKDNNYLAALVWDSQKQEGAVSWADFSTGEWTGLVLKKEEQIWQWVVKIDPREILLPQGYKLPASCSEFKARVNELPPASYFDLKSGAELIKKSQKVATLEVLDLADKPALIRVCGAILMYLLQTQKKDAETQNFADLHLCPFKPLNLSKYLFLDEVTERNLELFKRLDGQKGPGTLWYALDNTLTPMGGRFLKQRLAQPWKSIPTILKNQEVVEFLYTQDRLRDELRSYLDKIFDLERLSTRIFLNRCNPKDFVALRQSLSILPEIKKLFSQTHEDAANSEAAASTDSLPKNLNKILASWDDLNDVYELLKKSLKDNPAHLITEGGLFREGYDPELDQLIDLTEHGEARLKELLQQEQEQNNLPKLKLGYNKVFGYYFELSKAFKGQIPAHFERRQTLAASERFVTPELKQLEERLFSAAEKRKAREYNLFLELREKVAAQRQRFLHMADMLARLDFWQGLAQAARKWEWTKPDLSEELVLQIKAGRHPAIEAVQGRANYIPNDLYMDEQSKILLITGPNMAGKSTVLRQTAIICILAQIGSFVPAEKALIGVCDRIFSRVGASDNLAQGQSTFMVEMTETARILRQVSKRSLVILDEIGRGTSTFDGLSLAWAVVEELAQKYGGVRTLFATHYHELTSLEEKLSGVKNLNIAVKEWKGDIVFLRRLVPGPADRSYGIEVAKLAGVPQNVVARAKEILTDLEKKNTKLKVTVQSQKQSLPLRVPKVSGARQVLPGLDTESSPSAPCKSHPLLEELETLNLDNLTPVMALNILYEWKKRMKDEGRRIKKKDGKKDMKI